MAKPGRPPKYPGLIQAIIDNEQRRGTPDYRTPAELAADFNCPPIYIYQVRKRYLTREVGSATSGRGSERARTFGLPPGASVDSFLTFLDTVAPIDAARRIQILSHLAQTGAPAVKIQAIKALEDLTRNTEGRVGPPPPLTSEERVARLVRVLKCVTPAEAHQAWEVAFAAPAPLHEPSDPLPPDSPAAPLPPPPLPAPMRDLPPEALGPLEVPSTSTMTTPQEPSEASSATPATSPSDTSVSPPASSNEPTATS